MKRHFLTLILLLCCCGLTIGAPTIRTETTSTVWSGWLQDCKKVTHFYYDGNQKILHGLVTTTGSSTGRVRYWSSETYNTSINVKENYKDGVLHGSYYEKYYCRCSQNSYTYENYEITANFNEGLLNGTVTIKNNVDNTVTVMTFSNGILTHYKSNDGPNIDISTNKYEILSGTCLNGQVKNGLYYDSKAKSAAEKWAKDSTFSLHDAGYQIQETEVNYSKFARHQLNCLLAHSGWGSIKNYAYSDYDLGTKDYFTVNCLQSISILDLNEALTAINTLDLIHTQKSLADLKSQTRPTMCLLKPKDRSGYVNDYHINVKFCDTLACKQALMKRLEYLQIQRDSARNAAWIKFKNEHNEFTQDSLDPNIIFKADTTYRYSKNGDYLWWQNIHVKKYHFTTSEPVIGYGSEDLGWNLSSIGKYDEKIIAEQYYGKGSINVRYFEGYKEIYINGEVQDIKEKIDAIYKEVSSFAFTYTEQNNSLVKDFEKNVYNYLRPQDIEKLSVLLENFKKAELSYEVSKLYKEYIEVCKELLVLQDKNMSSIKQYKKTAKAYNIMINSWSTQYVPISGTDVLKELKDKIADKQKVKENVNTFFNKTNTGKYEQQLKGIKDPNEIWRIVMQ